MEENGEDKPRPGCNDYRAEMILLGLTRQMQRDDLDEGERQRILAEIGVLEKRLGLV